MATKRAHKPLPQDRGRELNEIAQLYPWMVFDQGELELMTNLPREAVSAAFMARDVPAQCGRSRPEDIFAWVRKQDTKIQTGEIKEAARKGLE